MLPLSKRRALQWIIDAAERRRMTFYPQAIWRPGPWPKQNGGKNTCQGVVLHSMVGPYAAALGELDTPERRASWHYSVLKDGEVFQHYSDEVQAWHAGSAFNNSTIGIEHEGGLNPTNEPLTGLQRNASVSLIRWLAVQHNFKMERRVGLWEHNEVSDEPTACPSGRIAWEFYTEEDAMTQADKDEIVRRINDHTDMKMLQLIAFLVNTGVKVRP